jgi:hypothetical protein
VYDERAILVLSFCLCFVLIHHEKEPPKSGKLDHIEGSFCMQLEIEKLKIITLYPYVTVQILYVRPTWHLE